MTALVFVDTNVLLYARDLKAVAKRGAAQAWLNSLGTTGSGFLNLQVINEFTRWVLANEPATPLDDIRSDIQILRLWGDKPVGDAEVAIAWAVRERYRFSWFDCLLVAAADLAGCRYFLTEDMSAGVTFGSVTLIHPFKTSPADILN